MSHLILITCEYNVGPRFEGSFKLDSKLSNQTERRDSSEPFGTVVSKPPVFGFHLLSSDLEEPQAAAHPSHVEPKLLNPHAAVLSHQRADQGRPGPTRPPEGAWKKSSTSMTHAACRSTSKQEQFDFET